MDELGFSLRSLARYTDDLGAPIGLSTLADWVAGRTLPAERLESPRLRVLELALEEEIGEFSLLFASPSPATLLTSERAAQRPLTEVAGDPAEDPAVLHRAAGELQEWIRDVTGPQRALVQKVRTKTRIDADGMLLSTTSELTVRALHDLVDCYFFPHAYTAGPMPEVRAVKGCEISPRRLRNHPQVEAVEMVFPVLARGARHTLSFEVRYPRGERATFYARAFPNPLSEASLEISFDVPPAELRECAWQFGSAGSDEPWESRVLAAGTRTAHIVRSPAPPTGLGWSWRW